MPVEIETRSSLLSLVKLFFKCSDVPVFYAFVVKIIHSLSYDKDAETAYRPLFCRQGCVGVRECGRIIGFAAVSKCDHCAVIFFADFYSAAAGLGNICVICNI